MSDWRVLFLGQAPLGEACFRALCRAECSHLAIVAACSNPSAADHWWQSAEIANAARPRVPFVPNDRRRDRELRELVLATDANCLVSVQHPWRIPALLLQLVNYEAFNLHNGLLPEFGGFNASSHAILEGAPTSGATLHWMTEVIDGGPIAFIESFAIGSEDCAADVYKSTVAAGERVFSRLIEYFTMGRLPPRRPMPGPVRLHHRAELCSHRQILDASDSDEIDRKARAFWFPPFEPAYIVTPSDSRFYVCPSNRWRPPSWTRFHEDPTRPDPPARPGR